MAWTQKNGGLEAAAAGRSGCRSTRSAGSRRAPVGAPPEPASPRMRLARSFRLAAERDSRTRAGSPASCSGAKSVVRGDFISLLKPLKPYAKDTKSPLPQRKVSMTEVWRKAWGGTAFRDPPREAQNDGTPPPPRSGGAPYHPCRMKFLNQLSMNTALHGS